MAEQQLGTHLFVYGSLVRPGVLEEVIGRRHAGERLRARLAGYRREELPDYPYPLLRARAGAATDGILILDLEGRDFDALDRYEEVAEGVYERVAVEVQAWGCGPRPSVMAAQTYVAGPRIAHAQPRTL